MTHSRSETAPDRQSRILDAVVDILATEGIAGVSMRAVARRAGVALGLVNYHFDGKTGLVAAALRRIEEQDLELVQPEEDSDPVEQLRRVLRRVAEPEFLTTEYLSLRLQLWSLARVHQEFERINTEAQRRYREGIAALIAGARPALCAEECESRAADVDVVQNGIWLTALLGLDAASVHRSIERCEAIALGE